MCEMDAIGAQPNGLFRTIPVTEAVGSVLAHDITEIRKGEFKGRAFRKGHIVRPDDVCHLQRLGKERLFVLELAEDEVHEDDAAYSLAGVLMGDGVATAGPPKEGKISLVATRDGLLRVNRESLLHFNMVGEVMCATLHDHTLVQRGQTVAATRAIPLVIKRSVLDKVLTVTGHRHRSVVRVDRLRKPRAGLVITGNEVYRGKIKDSFAPIIEEKIASFGGEVVGVHFAPDDAPFITRKLRELVAMGADLLITTGGMSVDPDDVTRFAIRNLGATELTYGSAVLPGAMFLIAYLPSPGNGNGARPAALHDRRIPILGIPACGMYARATVFDLVLPRVLAGEHVGRRELAELGHGGLCRKCSPCNYPLCPFGK